MLLICLRVLENERNVYSVLKLIRKMIDSSCEFDCRHVIYFTFLSCKWLESDFMFFIRGLQ